MADVEVRGLKKAYGSTVVVDGVDLSIQHGQLLCLLGSSGCGKTTTLRLLAGFVEPDEGEILVGGRQLSAAGRVVPPERRNMSMIFQSYAVWPHMTVFHNVAYGLKLRCRSSLRASRHSRSLLSCRVQRPGSATSRARHTGPRPGGRWRESGADRRRPPGRNGGLVHVGRDHTRRGGGS